MEADDWHHVDNYRDLAEAIHQLAVALYPASTYAKKSCKTA